MRLTLRTLLAYLNDTGLKSRQRKDIASRIKKTDNARILMRHLKVITSDPSLEIIEPEEDEKFRDPNIVGTYLDSSMMEDQVPQFEKTCLASAPLLSEIANCHAILAKIFREETVAVPLEIRQKIYSLSPVPGQVESGEDYSDEHPVHVPTVTPERVALAQQEKDATADKSNGKPKSETKEKQTEKADDNTASENEARPLRPNRILMPAFIGLLMLALGLGAGWILAGGNLPFASTKKNVAGVNDNDKKADSKPVSKTEKSKLESAQDKNKPDSTSGQKKTDGKKTDPNSGDAKKTVTPSGQTGDGDKKNDAKSGKSDPGKTDPTKKQNVNSNDAAKKDKQKNGADNADNIAIEIPDDGKPRPLAISLVDENQLLVAHRKTDNRWLPLSSQSEISSNQTLKTFAGTTTRLALTDFAKLAILGRSQIKFKSKPNSNAAFQVQIDHGIIAVLGDQGSIDLEAAGQTCNIELERPGTEVWIYVNRFCPSRNLANLKDRIAIAQILVRKGKAKCAANGKSYELNNVRALEFDHNGKFNSGVLSRRPAWDSTTTSELNRMAAATIVKSLQRDEPIEPQLTKLTEDLRVEVVTMATRMLNWLGYYEPLFQLLDKENNKTVWSKSIEGFRQDLANNDELATAVTEAIKNNKESGLDVMFQMLIGFNNEQLAKGADRMIVDQLSSDVLAYRVLAIENLRQITGSTYLYRPEVDEQFRKSKVRRWNLAVDRKKIRFAEPFKMPRLQFAAAGGEPPPANDKAAEPDQTKKGEFESK
jgi:hypothetical protein